VITIDFETARIERRPHYPPKPVGVAIKIGARKARYYAWGHPTENNCTFEEARTALREAYVSGEPLLFHNAKFDLEVAEKHFGLSIPSWERIHDTMFQVFLCEPYATTFALKPTAERVLGLPPEEQDAVHAWLLEKRIVTKVQKDWGAYISEAPGKLVGRYAVGDVERTYALHKRLFAQILSMDMGAAYDRERRLMPILLRNEQQGLRVDLEALTRDVLAYDAAMFDADAWLRKRLKTPSLNVSSNEEFADALERAGVVTEFMLTAKGNRSVAKNSLVGSMFKDQEVFRVYGYRNRLATCVGTFMLPWKELAEANKGRIHTSWNQIKSMDGGAKTGRMSSSPNFQNIPKMFATGKEAQGWDYPTKVTLPLLPRLRSYVLPDKGEVFCHRDYSQQEIRVLAHYENSTLLDAFLMAKPPAELCDAAGRIDIHKFVQVSIKNQLGMALERGAVKTVNFGMLYGMGLATLAARLGVSDDEARTIRDAQRSVMPGMLELDKELKLIGRSGDFMRTWGGRVYYREPDDERDLSYKMLNHLIQGSSADITKQALINLDARDDFRGRLLVTVHDEINTSSKPRDVAHNMRVMREAMLDIDGIDVPMISDGKTGPRWSDLQPYKG
jgi:DNA polymerase-1